jgi:hypothetical protein
MLRRIDPAGSLAPAFGSRETRSRRGGTVVVLAALLDGADAHYPFRELGMLPHQFTLERVALLTTHRRNVERIIWDGDVLDGFFRSAMDTRDPGVSSPVRSVRVVRPDPGQMGGHDLVSVLFELSSQLVAERLAPGLCLGSSNLRASLCAFGRIEPGLARVSQAKLRPFQSWGGTGFAFLVPSGAAACLQGVWRYLRLRCRDSRARAEISSPRAGHAALGLESRGAGLRPLRR